MKKLSGSLPLIKMIIVRDFIKAGSLSVLLALSACGGGGGSSVGGTGDQQDSTDDTASELRALAQEMGRDGDPANGLEPVRPDEDPLVKLGQILFFSRTLSGRMGVACASCHHPDFAGADGLSLSVGVAARNPAVLGPNREIDPQLDLAPDADGGPNVPRNSQTVFNAALYDRAMFHDGRVFVLEDQEVQGGTGQDIRTPESGNVADANAGNSLLSAQAKMPLVANDEMRGYMYSELASPSEYRGRLVARLRGSADQGYMSADAATNWQQRFTNAFGSTNSDGRMITMARIQKALAEYQRSMIFVDTPWKRFLEGDDDALSAQARKGAELFLRSPAEGGLGCAGCHSRDTFSSEQFYNLGFPQIGRGKRASGADRGRADVSVNNQTDGNEHAFRVPGLLNVELTAPYGHAGTFSTLREVIRYHLNPRDRVNFYDFSLSGLDQFEQSGETLYPDAETLTRNAIAASSFDSAEQMIPARQIDAEKVDQLIAFLRSLTADCAAQPTCRDAWIPDGEADDPDGNLLVRGEAIDDQPPQPSDSAAQVELNFPSLTTRTTFPDAQGCDATPTTVSNTHESRFIRRDQDRGLTASHGYNEATWLANSDLDSHAIDETMQAGGITAAYLTDSCWPDLIFTGGNGPDNTGVVLYENQGGHNGFVARPEKFDTLPSGPFTSVGVADLNGDYRRELLFANLHQGDLPIYARTSSATYASVGSLSMGRSTFGMAFGDSDGNGYPNLYLAHWSPTGVPGSAPAFWRNDGTTLSAADESAGTTEDVVTQSNNFAPGFADLNRDHKPDLAIASDFETSMVMQNDGQGGFVNKTDRDVIDDSNGMGSAIADFNNDGRLDWFVTSVELSSDYEWDGNRLYWNATSAGGEIRFTASPGEDGIVNGAWGWGACAADFNNDGWQDIFHVNGFGKIPDYLAGGPMDSYIEDYSTFAQAYGDRPPRLFINNGDGTFTERAAAWNIDVPSEGRGVVCFDYDRDGDVDIGLVDHSSGIQFFENQIGHTSNAFMNIRLVGEKPNTQALGARVWVSADVDSDDALERLTRISAANNNFASQGLTNMHFGLGTAGQIDKIKVRWPDGTTETCEAVPVNRFLIFEQSQGVSCPTVSK